MGCNAHRLQLGDEVPLPRKEIGDVDGPFAVGPCAREGDDQPFGAAGSEPLDDVQDAVAGPLARRPGSCHHRRSVSGVRSECISTEYIDTRVERGGDLPYRASTQIASDAGLGRSAGIPRKERSQALPSGTTRAQEDL